MKASRIENLGTSVSLNNDTPAMTQQDYVKLQQQFTALTYSQKQFSALYEHAPVSYLVLTQDLKIIEANIQARRVLNLTERTISNEKTFLSFVVKGVANFLSWIHSGIQEGLTIELHDANHKGQVKAFVTSREVDSQKLYFLTLISIAEEHRLNESLKLHQLVFENAQEAIFITDKNFNIQQVNPAFTKICGYTQNDMLGKKPSIHCENDADAEKYSDLFQAAISDGSSSGIIKTNHKEHRTFHQRLTLTAVFSDNEQTQTPIHYIGIFENIDEQIEKEKLLHTLAEKDPLSKLYNRQGFTLQFDKLFTEAQRDGDDLALFFLDLDKFKYLNDKYGHDYGDILLATFAARLKNNFKKTDVIARIGGDEFVVLLKGNLPDNVLIKLAEKLNKNFTEPYRLLDIKYTCKASIGAALYPKDALTKDELMKAADSAMYCAKKQKRNQFHLFNQTIFDQQLNKVNLLIDIENDILDNNFIMYYQPQHNIVTNEIVGFESLARWNYKGKEIRSPAQFLPLIENDHLMIKLGKKILENVFVQVNAWFLAGFKWPVAINLSADQLSEPSIIKLISHLVDVYPQVVPYIHLEITESTIFENNPIIFDAIEALHAWGFKIVLDDFGTGYSSIYSLKKFTFEIIKIDKCFVDDILTKDTDNLLILNTLVQLVQGLSLDIICEGVEKKEQIDYLKNIGCAVVQGYFYSKPMPKHEVLQYTKLEHSPKAP